jgi:hypothetical protein
VFKDPASVVYTSLEGKRVSLLIYETTDTDFADTAIEALAGAGISSHRTGRGYSSSSAHPGKGFTEDQVCIYIESESDFRAANDILIKLGAVVDQPPRLPSRRVIFLVALILTGVFCWIVLH